MTRIELCKMCNEYSADTRCEFRETCKLQKILTDNVQLRAENKELKATVSVICANPRERKLYDLKDVMFITDQGQPLILIDVGKESDMDEEMKKACEECESDDLAGQMQIEDFPEVMP